jgi:hypothetical protein
VSGTLIVAVPVPDVQLMDPELRIEPDPLMLGVAP